MKTPDEPFRVRNVANEAIWLWVTLVAGIGLAMGVTGLLYTLGTSEINSLTIGSITMIVLFVASETLYSLRCIRCGLSKRGVHSRRAIWNLANEEIARKFPITRLSGLWPPTVLVPKGMVGLLLVDEKLDKVFGPGLVSVSFGIARLFSMGKKTMVLVRATEMPIDFLFKTVYTKDSGPVSFTCRLVVKLHLETAVPFLTNILATENRLTFNDLKQILGEELKEVFQSYLKKHLIAEQAYHFELKELEAEIEFNLRRILANTGLTFISLHTILLEETLSAVAEQRERRYQLWQRMRQAAQSDKMNEVRSEQEFENFLHSIDEDRLLREREFEELLQRLKDKLADQERTRAHLARIAELKYYYEYKNAELARHREYTQAHLQAEVELQAKQMDVELRLLDLQLDKTQKEDEIKSLVTAAHRAGELSDAEYRRHMEDIGHALDARRRTQEWEAAADLYQAYKSWKETKLGLETQTQLQKVEAERRELEASEQTAFLELAWLHAVDDLEESTKAHLAATQKLELLAGLAKINALIYLPTEQLLDFVLASVDSPKVIDVLKSMVTMASSLEEKNLKDLFERQASEQKQFRDYTRAMNENFIKAQRDALNKISETLTQIAKNKDAEKG